MTTLSQALLDALWAKYESAWNRYTKTQAPRDFQKQAAIFQDWKKVYTQATGARQ